ncbi:hypothetical protein Ctob_016379, partial [Chrysochromulina tobinii]
RGGGVCVWSGTVTFSSCTITGNTGSDGGGVYVRGGTVAFSSCTITGNTANSEGGGVYVFGETGTVAVSSGYAQNGGGVYVEGGTVTISSCTISGNTAALYLGYDDKGGGVYVQGGTWQHSWHWMGWRCPYPGWHSGHLIVHHQWELSSQWRRLDREFPDLLQHSKYRWRRCLCPFRHSHDHVVHHQREHRKSWAQCLCRTSHRLLLANDPNRLFLLSLNL